MNRSMTKPKSFDAAGFTLIELLLAMSIFSLLMLISYQSLTTTVLAKLRVSQLIEEQSERRATYRTLANAFDSGATITGNVFSVDLDLSTADSSWLEGSNRIQFVLGEDDSLSANIDTQLHTTHLLSGLEQAEFWFVDDDLAQQNWVGDQTPSAVELRWMQNGVLRHWRFDIR